MPAQLRRILLALHIAVSVGWIGSVAAFLSLALLGRTSADAVAVVSAYVAMNTVSLCVVTPLSIAALLSGILMALATPWGLFKHYWVMSKLTITLLAAALLMLHQFSAVAVAAAQVRASTEALPSAGRLGLHLIVDASLAVTSLLIVVAIAVFKPRGLTTLGRRGQTAQTIGGPGRWGFLAALASVVVLFFVMHATGMTAANH